MGDAGSAGLRGPEREGEHMTTADDCIRSEDDCIRSEDDCIRSEDDCIRSEDDCIWLEDDCIRSEDGCIRSEDDCIWPENEVDYLQLSCEAMERVQMHSRSLQLNQAQCRLLADSLSNSVQSAKHDVHGLDPASVQLFAPAFRELCRVACDCEKLVRDCSEENWLPVVLMLVDSRQEFLLRVSELKWCVRAWRTILKHGLQGGVWLKQFHKSSQISVADRRRDMSDETARLRIAFEEDLETLRAKCAEMQGNVDVGEEVRELAGHVLGRFEMIGAVRPRYNEQERSKYELPHPPEGTNNRMQLLGHGSSGSVHRISWFEKDFAGKDVNRLYEYFDKEVAAMIKINGHPRIVNFLGVLSNPTSESTAILMELMPSDLGQFLNKRSVRDIVGKKSSFQSPVPLDVAVDIMLQVAEGVEVLHKVQLFHRDLKSYNILVEPVEVQPLRDAGYVRVKLADFGETEARSRTFGDQKTGTTGWRAPEIGYGSDGVLVYPAKADTFSYAILCSEILSGHIPFDDILRSRIWEFFLEGGRPELPARLPSQLVSLVQRCWDYDPTKRPTFAVICKELRYLKFLITIGGEMQFRALDNPDEDDEATAEIVKHLRWIDQDKLHFVRHLGSGGYGSVDECEWQGQRVAVKNLLRVGKKDVEKEAALLVRVEHPNVVKVIGCCFNEKEEKGMIVMELMDQDLHQLIKKRLRSHSSNGAAPFSLGVALEIMWKVATAMKHVRDCNVLHRDLKTTNILVNERTGTLSATKARTEYDVKLADFGLSKYKSGNANFTTRASEAQFWQAPETSEARNYSWPADVYSFGVVCYEIISGEKPFKGMEGPEVWKSVRDGRRPEIPEYCPTTVADLVNACWATIPEERPAFAEICTMLEACMIVLHNNPQRQEMAEGQ